MWLKFCGALLLLGAGSVWGQVLAARLWRRPVELAALEFALQGLETEITYLATPLPRLLGDLAGRVPAALAPLFRETAASLTAGLGVTAAEAWGEALARLRVGGGSALAESDWEILTELGAYLGASPAADQGRHLQYIRERLGAARVAALETYNRNGRLYRYFGMAIPLILILWLW